MATTNPTICFLVLLLLVSPCLSGATNILFSDIGDGILDTGKSLLYNGSYWDLYMQLDCNLCLYKEGEQWPYWYTNTAPRGKNCQLKLQSNGELVLSGNSKYSGRRIVLWRSHNTSTVGSYALVLNYDGSLGVYGPPIWSVPKSLKLSTSTGHSSNLLPNAPSTIDSTIWTGDIAPIGTTIANGDYKLELQKNCNLTLSNDKTKETLWYTNTKDPYNSYNCFVTLEKNGLFVIKYLGGTPLWNSRSHGPDKSEYVLALRPDGNLAIYGPPIWKVKVNVKEITDLAVAKAYGEKIAMVTEE